MNKFKFNFSITVWILMTLGVLVCLLGGIFNIINGIKAFNNLNYGLIKGITSLVLGCFCFVILFALVFMMIKSEYKITKTHILLRLGLFVSKIAIDEVIGFSLNAKKQTLVCVCKGEKGAVILISSSSHGDFIASVKKFKPEVTVAFEQ